MKTNVTNNIMRWAMVCLIAFTAPGMASAQFGGLKKMVKSATKGVVGDAVKDKTASDVGSVSADSDPYGASQIDRIKANKQQAEADRQRAEEQRQKVGCKIVESRRDKLVGMWNSRTNTITSAEQFEDGAMKGKFITYTWNPSTGEIKRNDGEVVATIQDGKMFIKSINATIEINSTGGLKINGESCGKVTRQDIYIFGRRLGQFYCEATRDLVAFFFLNNYATPEMIAKLKRTQYMDGNYLNASGTMIGYIKGGMIYNTSKLVPKQGSMHYSDDETVIGDNKFRVGAFQYDGRVDDNNGNKIGQVKENGDILNASGVKVAHVSSDGKITDKAGKFLVKFSGDRPVMAAVAYYFFFRDRIR